MQRNDTICPILILQVDYYRFRTKTLATSDSSMRLIFRPMHNKVYMDREVDPDMSY